MTHPDLGFFLRQLRRSRRMSQAEAARGAQISRVTLGRWEAGIQQPRELELKSLLASLAVSPQQFRHAFVLHKAGRKKEPSLSLIIKVGKQKELGPLPNGGELLRTLRMRSGLSQLETARRTGVTERTIRRWEKSEAWPSVTQLHTLCYVLGAHPAEMLMLTTNRFLHALESETLSAEELEMQGYDLYYLSHSGATVLTELGFLTAESKAWALATRSEGGRRVLSQIYSYHAAYLSRYGRLSESSVYAQRALDLWPQAVHRDALQVMAGIVDARATVYRGTQPAPLRGLEILRHWLDATPWPQYKAWVLSETAKYLAQAGDITEACLLAKRAKEVTKQCPNPYEFYNRTLDEAQVLIWSGEPKRAFSSLQQAGDHLRRDCPAQVGLLETEAYLKQNQLSLAHDRLQKTWHIIEDGTLLHLMPQAKKLALHF